jgi:hypothetical protein
MHRKFDGSVKTRQRRWAIALIPLPRGRGQHGGICDRIPSPSRISMHAGVPCVAWFQTGGMLCIYGFGGQARMMRRLTLRWSACGWDTWESLDWWSVLGVVVSAMTGCMETLPFAVQGPCHVPWTPFPPRRVTALKQILLGAPCERHLCLSSCM